MRRFFSWGQDFWLFSRKSKIQTANRQFAQADQWCSASSPPSCGIYFPGASAGIHLPKKRREIPGGEGVRHDSFLWGGKMSEIMQQSELSAEGELRVEYWPIDRLIPSARNARTHSAAQVAEIAGSIRTFGFTNPLLVGEDADVVAGQPASGDYDAHCIRVRFHARKPQPDLGSASRSTSALWWSWAGKLTASRGASRPVADRG
jgi:hypothetical protein